MGKKGRVVCLPGFRLKKAATSVGEELDVRAYARLGQPIHRPLLRKTPLRIVRCHLVFGIHTHRDSSSDHSRWEQIGIDRSLGPLIQPHRFHYRRRHFRETDDQDSVKFREWLSLVPVRVYDRSFSEKTKVENSPRSVSFFLSEPLFFLIKGSL